MGEGVKKIITINSTYLFTHQVAVENQCFYGMSTAFMVMSMLTIFFMVKHNVKWTAAIKTRTDTWVSFVMSNIK